MFFAAPIAPSRNAPELSKFDGAMAMLTRDAIKSGAYLEHFKSMPNLWAQERIQSSLAETMRAKPGDTADIWIFAYGSLMWNPVVEFEKRLPATLHGWHRSFCLRMVAGRGSPDGPGRMLALRRGGHTSGVALKLPLATLDEELRLIWTREMVLGSYVPMWASITLNDGTETHAIAFVADESREQFEPDSCVATVVPLIGTATGQFGSNADYVLRLHESLLEHGLHDSYIDELASGIERLPRRVDSNVIGASE